ncbi:MAG: hypothetical protein A2X13_12685 [Bacteroidetes bacterium GWC2_33_15]|nr:MAG: hypothetical protein A2X10_14010 [Bacteroidetes bacterium GWA2_33_15]OFX50642.1 MAG: hypothetical protein A2X13_12685 [Bacteroidetes bacterium GWC2_33_15]OFX63262.1 MAG: hypothetical protein A2X15_02115 [Bacteroidetes bacterium GWB2_32_14]OFX69791.1 MAG: hypothetical protein A2X14_05360 [Bacteroidetes bacterium GWD2_33_33]HAN19832.1 YdcF family protein [Bacteroidales bacterium]
MRNSICKNFLTIFLTILLVNSGRLFAKNPKYISELKSEKFIYDAIIVPGVPYNDPNMSKVLIGRIYWSYYLYSKGTAKNVIYSGSAVYTPYVEAIIMSMYAKELGVPEERIILETKAEHSIENVYYSYKIARKMGFKKIALATDPFQSRLMKRPSKRLKVDIDFIPFSFEFLDSVIIPDIQIIADKAYIKDFVSIEERESFFKRLRGTIGKNIKYKD